MAFSLAEVQQAFVAHAYGESHPAMDELLRVPGNAAGLRVYAASRRGKLWDALGAVYPVVSALLGDQCFGSLARRYATGEPSRSADIHAFGGTFAEFLAAAPELGALEFIADVARLEWAWHESYHAPDEPILNCAELASISPSRTDRLKLRLARHSRLLTCRYPAAAIWEAHRSNAISKASLEVHAGCYSYVVVRSAAVPVILTSTTAEQGFLSALALGKTLSEAFDISGADAAALANWIVAGVIIEWVDDG